GQQVDVVGEVLPRPGHTGHDGLPTQAPIGADFARHARHFSRERVQLVHHGVQRLLQVEDFAVDVHRDLLGEVTAGHGRGHLGDVAHLPGQVAGHGVDVVGEVFPGPGDTRHVGLAAELAFGTDLARHTRHF